MSRIIYFWHSHNSPRCVAPGSYREARSANIALRPLRGPGRVAARYIDESGNLNLAPPKNDCQVYDANSHIITIAEQM